MNRTTAQDRQTERVCDNSRIPGGLASFPTVCDCDGSRPRCEGPDLTPRTALLLTVAGRRLADEVRALGTSSMRPAPLSRLAYALDGLAQTLECGLRPMPGTLGEQLCLHVMIAYATDLAFEVGDDPAGDLPYSEYDYDYERLYDTLLPDHRYEGLIWEVQQSPRGGGCFDFATLCEVTPPGILRRLFTHPAK
ncbi:hypothetical protein [Nocardia alni]|uniref:hypothetical protein n=1 Tax=Nocardia alni TaxID=2815723 RepID=UPI001C214DCC|nr:hypothetical protein [Nocardia alni]